MTAKDIDPALKVLIVENSVEDRTKYKHLLSEDSARSYRIEETGSGSNGLERIRAYQPDTILLGHRLSDMTGLEFLSALAAQTKDFPCPVIVINGQGNELIATEFMKNGALDYLVKDSLTSNSLHQSIHSSLLVYRRKLRENYAAHAQILDSISDGFYALDAEGRFIYVNKVFEQVLKTRWEDLIGKNIRDVIPNIMFTASYEVVYRAFTEQVKTEGEAYSTLIGRWIRINAYPANGGVSVYFQDITARKQYEEQLQSWNEELERRVDERTGELAAEIEERKQTADALQESKELYQSVLNTLSEGVVVHGLDGTILAANPSAERILGIPGPQINGRNSSDPRWQAIHEDGTPFPGETHPAMITLQTGQACAGVKMGLRRPDGTLRWISINTQPLFQADGVTLRGVVSSFIDITESCLAERALKESEEQYRLLYNNAFYGVLVGTIDGQVLAANPNACKMLGYEESEIITLGRAGIVDLSKSSTPLDFARIRREISVQWESEYIHKTGQRIPVEIATSLYLDRTGRERLCVIFKDISERKKIEEKLRASEEQYRLLAENSLDMVFKNDLQGITTYVSPACREILGYEPDELTGSSAFDYFHPTDLALIRANIEQSPSNAGISRVEYRCRKKDGSYVWLQTRSRGYFDPVFGKPIYTTGIARDITAQKQAEEKLRRQEQEFRALVENSPDMVLRTTLDLQALYVNPAFTRHTGLTAEQVIGQTVTPTHSHLGASRTLVELRDRVLKSGLPETTEYEFMAHHGKKAYLHYQMVPEFNSEGKLESLLVIARDLTELKKAQVELLNRERFQTLFELSPDAVCLSDMDGYLISCNRALEILAGLPREKMLGMRATDLGFINKHQLDEILEQMLTKGIVNEVLTRDVAVKRADQTELILEIKVMPVIMNEKPHFIATLRDISSRKQLEVELRQALEQQKELSELKSRFISTMSHEFRTPLTIIQASGEVLSRYIDKMSQEQIKSRMEKIKEQIAQAVKLVDDVLIYNRFQAHTYTYEPLPGNIAEFCREYVQEMVELDNGAHRFKVLVPETPVSAVFDRFLLRQLVNNLVSNATKYSERGTEIEIEINKEQETVVIRVADQGIGIPEKEQARIFELFFRAGNVGTTQGTGLGLAILKEALTLNGGQISFSSREGQGTTFIVTLPLQA